MAINELTSFQQALLRNVPGRYPPERIDRLWIFPPHVAPKRESGFIVLSLLQEDGDDDRRTVVTLRYSMEEVKGRPKAEERVTEEGSAPPERIDRVIAGVLARSGEDDVEPIAAEIGGDPERWTELLTRHMIDLDPTYRE